MKGSNSLEIIERPADRELPRLKVLVMYEDRAVGQRAKSLLDRLAIQIGIEVELTMQLWRFDLLDLPEALEQAAFEAAAADVILLSVNQKSKLALADQKWLDRWLDHKEDRPYLFCLVLGSEWDRRRAEIPLINELENFTSNTGVGFFCGTIETPSGQADVAFGDLHLRAHHLSSVLEGILNQDSHHRAHPSWRNAR